MKREVITGSSNILEIGYDKSSKRLQVKFSSGGIYDYFPVEEDKFNALMGSDSRGKYLNDEIKWAAGVSYNRVG